MKALVILFLSAVLSFSGLAVLDRRARISEKTSGDVLTDRDAALFGLSSADVRERLGKPISIAENHYGMTIWTYRNRVIEFNHRGEVSDVVAFTPGSK